MADLKFGPLPKKSTVKVTVELRKPLLKEELDAYPAEHSKLCEPVESKALIPHMLEAFLRSDRAGAAAENRFGTKSRRTRPHIRHKPISSTLK